MIFFNDFWNTASFFFWIFALVACLIALFGIIPDLFRDHTLPGWAKALWLLFLIFIPFLAVLVYVVVRGRQMAERKLERFDRDLDESSTFGVGGMPIDEIARAKQMLDEGKITQEDYDKLRADGNA